MVVSDLTTFVSVLVQKLWSWWLSPESKRWCRRRWWHPVYEWSGVVKVGTVLTTLKRQTERRKRNDRILSFHVHPYESKDLVTGGRGSRSPLLLLMGVWSWELKKFTDCPWLYGDYTIKGTLFFHSLMVMRSVGIIIPSKPN